MIVRIIKKLRKAIQFIFPLKADHKAARARRNGDWLQIAISTLMHYYRTKRRYVMRPAIVGIQHNTIAYS